MHITSMGFTRKTTVHKGLTPLWNEGYFSVSRTFVANSLAVSDSPVIRAENNRRPSVNFRASS